MNQNTVIQPNTVNLNVKKLTEIVSLCFANARDNENFTTTERTTWLIRGKILRGHLVNLLSAAFSKEDFPQVEDANKQLKEIVKQLRKKQSVLQNVNKVLQDLTNLATILEQLIGHATFV